MQALLRLDPRVLRLLVVAVPAMVLAGMAWITTANTLSVSAQLALPNWVRARGMSIYQMSIMGATAAGAALWGQVASLTDVQTSLGLAAVSGGIVMAVVQHLVADRAIEEDLSPSSAFKAPTAPTPPEAGRVVVTIEYFIHPARANEFRAVMQETRRSRLRQGALHWQLMHDISNPTRYVERIEDDGTRQVLTWLRDLFGLGLIEKNAAWYLIHGRISTQRAQAIVRTADQVWMNWKKP